MPTTSPYGVRYLFLYTTTATRIRAKDQSSRIH